MEDTVTEFTPMVFSFDRISTKSL